MPMIVKSPTIQANTTNENIFQGSAFEFAMGRGMMSLGITAAGAGQICNIQAGRDIVAEAFELPVIGAYPLVQDSFYFQEVVETGDRIVARVQNTTAGNVITRAVLQLSFGG